MVRSPSQEAAGSPLLSFPTIPQALHGQTILVTGGAGFVGTGLLYRLVGSDISPRRIYTVIRGENPISRLPVDIHPFVAQTLPDGTLSAAPIIILKGDCFLPNFGLTPSEAKCLNEIDIVIHTAGDTRFLLPLAEAVHAIADLATALAYFSTSSHKVRTHIHLSTTFTGWFLPNGSTVHEELVPALDPTVSYDEHANTYLHAKSIAEGLVNAIFRPQAGRPKSKVNCRLVRLATVGPAASFPYPGYGAGSPSSPVCSAIAAVVVGRENYLPEAELDVVPLDIAILALTAACHSKPLALTLGSNVPIYHVAGGLGPNAAIPMNLLNEPEIKLAEPYVPAKNLLRAYSPMITRRVRFDTSRTREVLGLPPNSKASPFNRDLSYGLTSPVTDGSIDCAGFVVDAHEAIEALGGWKPYLVQIRDMMERSEEGDDFEAHVD